jgi:hypothetical protein
MMRAVRERPRVAAVTVLGAVVLVLCGAALGALLAGGWAEIPQTAQVRLASAQQATREQTELLDAARVQAAEARASLARQTRRSRAGAHQRAAAAQASAGPASCSERASASQLSQRISEIRRRDVLQSSQRYGGRRRNRPARAQTAAWLRCRNGRDADRARGPRLARAAGTHMAQSPSAGLGSTST